MQISVFQYVKNSGFFLFWNPKNFCLTAKFVSIFHIISTPCIVKRISLSSFPVLASERRDWSYLLWIFMYARKKFKAGTIIEF